MNDPDVLVHLKRGADNESLAAELKERIPTTDWRIVVNFYAALHFVQAYLISKNIRFHAKRHHERKDAIRKSPELRHPFPTHYAILQDVSEQVRYDPGFVASGHVADSHNWLATTKATVFPKLRSKGYAV